MRRLSVLALVLAFAALPAHAAEIDMLCTGATKAVVEAMVRQFEAATGHKVKLTADTAGGATRRVEAGEAYDVVVIVPAAIDALIAKGKLAAGSRSDIASVGIGVGVRENERSPDISTVESFTAALRAARAIAYVDPAAAAPAASISATGWSARASRRRWRPRRRCRPAAMSPRSSRAARPTSSCTRSARSCP